MDERKLYMFLPEETMIQYSNNTIVYEYSTCIVVYVECSMMNIGLNSDVERRRRWC
jgi:hypothetical protein